MLTVLSLIAPLFALIVLGFTIGRVSYLSPGADKLLAEFGFKVAMPALLFRATSTFAPLPASPLSLIIVYFGASALVWLLATMAARHVLKRPAPDAPVVAMGACFGNTVMLGIPLALLVLGPEAAVPIAILVSIETPLLWVLATLHVEWAVRGRSGVSLSVLGGVMSELARNPIVLSIVLGVLWRTTGLALPAELDRLIALLGQAAIPTALVALGLTLSNIQIRGEVTTVALITGFKLLLFPALVFAATRVIDLSATWAAVAILFAAMPTGANAYLFAVRSDRVINSISGSLVVTTLIAAITISLLLYGAGWSAPR